MAELTPMMRQYLKMKEENPGCLLFFRLGDFYEMFNDDAKVGAEELGLTLTTRDRNKPEDERVPMCGVPYHSAQSYIARLIKRGPGHRAHCHPRHRYRRRDAGREPQ